MTARLPATWLGSPWPDERAAWRNHCAHAGGHALGEDEHAEALAALRRACEGHASTAGLAGLLDRLAVPWPPRPDSERPVVGPQPLGTRELARIALDTAPAAGEDGPRACLGPWAAALDVRQPRHHRAWAASVAASVFSLHDDRRSPARAWTRDGVRPPLARRERLHVVARTPPSAWRLMSAESAGWCVAPLLRLGQAWIPSMPVDLSCVGGVDGPPRVGGLLLGRVVPSPTGPVAVAAMVLPQAPPAAVLAGWFARVALPQLVLDRDIEREEILRRVGHHIVGMAHAWWWAERGPAAWPLSAPASS